MSEQIDQSGRDSGIEDTRGRIAVYSVAAQGLVDIHTYSHNGQVQVEYPTEPGVPVDEGMHAELLAGFDADGVAVTLDYDGTMAPEACMQLAEGLQQQLDAQSAID